MNTEFLVLATPVILAAGFVSVAIVLVQRFVAQG